MMYKLENEEELTNTINAIAENWADFEQKHVEEYEMDGYEIADQKKWDGWWKQYTDCVASDISCWIEEEYDITFDDDDDADGDADDLEDDVTANMKQDGYDDGIDSIAEVLKTAGLIRKDVAEDKMTA